MMAKRKYQLADAMNVEASTAAKERILVADPDEDTRALYCEWFQRFGCDVVEATDGREALTEALVRPPALVVCDTRLPFIDGYALCEILRRDYATTRVPILVVTSEARAVDLARAKAAGANAVLVKPAMPEQVVEETRRLLATTTSVPDGRTGDPVIAEDPRTPRPRRRLSKSLARICTTTPPLTPPAAVCPSCDSPLTYRHSHLGGVSERQPEQWDGYVCSQACGAFEYRHRTRTLRQLVDDGMLV